MDLRPLIADIASRADDFLAGATDRPRARVGIEEYLTLEYPDFTPDARKEIVDGVIAVLEAEDFFGTEFVGDAFKDEESEANE